MRTEMLQKSDKLKIILNNLGPKITVRAITDRNIANRVGLYRTQNPLFLIKDNLFTQHFVLIKVKIAFGNLFHMYFDKLMMLSRNKNHGAKAGSNLGKSDHRQDS